MCRPKASDKHLDYGAKGVLLALAHEFDMPAMTRRIKHMLLDPVRDSIVGDFVEAVRKRRKTCSCTISLRSDIESATGVPAA